MASVMKLLTQICTLVRKKDSSTQRTRNLERLLDIHGDRENPELVREIKTCLMHKSLPITTLNDLPLNLVRSVIGSVYGPRNQQPYFSAEPFIYYAPQVLRFYTPEAPSGIDEVLKSFSGKYGLPNSFFRIGEAIAENHPIRFEGMTLILPEGKERLDLAVKMMQFGLIHNQKELHQWLTLARTMNQKANLTRNRYGELQDARNYFNLVIDMRSKTLRNSRYTAPIDYEFQYNELREKLDFLMQHPEQGNFINDADRTHRDLLRVWEKVKKYRLLIDYGNCEME